MQLLLEVAVRFLQKFMTSGLLSSANFAVPLNIMISQVKDYHHCWAFLPLLKAEKFPFPEFPSISLCKIFLCGKCSGINTVENKYLQLNQFHQCFMGIYFKIHVSKTEVLQFNMKRAFNFKRPKYLISISV